MRQAVLVGIGGCWGVLARHKLSGVILHLTPGWRFPLGTFAVNVAGCFVAGIVAGLIDKRALFGSDLRLLLLTGILGGFTTFSAFSLETLYLMQRQQVAVALANVGTNVALGVLALWCGIKIIP